MRLRDRSGDRTAGRVRQGAGAQRGRAAARPRRAAGIHVPARRLLLRRRARRALLHADREFLPAEDRDPTAIRRKSFRSAAAAARPCRYRSARRKSRPTCATRRRTSGRSSSTFPDNPALPVPFAVGDAPEVVGTGDRGPGRARHHQRPALEARRSGPLRDSGDAGRVAHVPHSGARTGHLEADGRALGLRRQGRQTRTGRRRAAGRRRLQRQPEPHRRRSRNRHSGSAGCAHGHGRGGRSRAARRSGLRVPAECSQGRAGYSRDPEHGLRQRSRGRIRRGSRGGRAARLRRRRPVARGERSQGTARGGRHCRSPCRR